MAPTVALYTQCMPFNEVFRMYAQSREKTELRTSHSLREGMTHTHTVTARIHLLSAARAPTVAVCRSMKSSKCIFKVEKQRNCKLESFASTRMTHAHTSSQQHRRHYLNRIWHSHRRRMSEVWMFPISCLNDEARSDWLLAAIFRYDVIANTAR